MVVGETIDEFLVIGVRCGRKLLSRVQVILIVKVPQSVMNNQLALLVKSSDKHLGQWIVANETGVVVQREMSFSKVVQSVNWRVQVKKVSRQPMLGKRNF